MCLVQASMNESTMSHIQRWSQLRTLFTIHWFLFSSRDSRITILVTFCLLVSHESFSSLKDDRFVLLTLADRHWSIVCWSLEFMRQKRWAVHSRKKSKKWQFDWRKNEISSWRDPLLLFLWLQHQTNTVCVCEDRVHTSDHTSTSMTRTSHHGMEP